MKKRQFKKFVRKFRNYYEPELVGFSGTGPSALDKDYLSKLKKRPRIMPKEWEFIKSHDLIAKLKKIKKDSFRKACIDVLGEDPETDWVPQEEI